MPNLKVKQVTINIPKHVYDRANRLARLRKTKKDGLKLLPTGLMREWMMKGMEADENVQR